MTPTTIPLVLTCAMERAIYRSLLPTELSASDIRRIYDAIIASGLRHQYEKAAA